MAPKIWRKKCVILLRVLAFDHANPWEGLLVSPNFFFFVRTFFLLAVGVRGFHTGCLSPNAYGLLRPERQSARPRCFGEVEHTVELRARKLARVRGRGPRASERRAAHSLLHRYSQSRPPPSFYDAFSRSTKPIHCKHRCVTPNGRKNVSFYFAFLRLTSRQNVSFYDAFSRTTRPIHCKNRGFTQKVSF